MNKKSLFYPYYLSFYSKKLYQEVFLQWRGIGLLYLLVLLAICWIPSTMVFNRIVQAITTNSIIPIVKQLPEITIKKGKLSINQPSPYVIKNPNTGEAEIIFDISGNQDSLQNSKASMLVTQDYIYSRGLDGEINKHSLLSRKDTYLDEKIAMHYVQLFRRWWFIIGYPLFLAVSFVYRIIQILIYALIGFAFSRVINTEMDYLSIVRLASVAITPAIIISTIFAYFAIVLPMMLFIYFIISMFYLGFAIYANKGMSPIDGSDEEDDEDITSIN